MELFIPTHTVSHGPHRSLFFSKISSEKASFLGHYHALDQLRHSLINFSIAQYKQALPLNSATVQGTASVLCNSKRTARSESEQQYQTTTLFILQKRPKFNHQAARAPRAPPANSMSKKQSIAISSRVDSFRTSAFKFKFAGHPGRSEVKTNLYNLVLTSLSETPGLWQLGRYMMKRGLPKTAAG